MDGFQNIFKDKLLETSISFLSGAALIALLFTNSTLYLFALIAFALLFSYAWPKLLILKHPISITLIISTISIIAIILQTFFTQLGTLSWQIYIFVLAFLIAIIDELFINKKDKNPMSSVSYSFFGSFIAVSSVGWISLMQLTSIAKLYALFSLIILCVVSFTPILESKIFEKLNYQHFNYVRFTILGSIIAFIGVGSYFFINAISNNIVSGGPHLSWKLSALICGILFAVFVVKMVLFSDIHIRGSAFAKALFPIMILGTLIYISLTIFAR
ncbi:MAG: hypothetical protein LBB10_02905 [Bifidobacteriaceae bacterium]|jgi:hypothetical protein|nr:hypothetical protein [Bifidobacteriaceae bacterium]